MYEAKKLWMYYPDDVAQIAKRERIFNATVDMLMPSVLANTYYMRYIKMEAEAKANPSAYPPVEDTRLAAAKEIVKFTAIGQAGSSMALTEKNLEYVELTWPAYEAKMREKPAFAAWFFDVGVAYSFFLYQFYIDVDGFLGFDPELRKLIKPITTYQMDTAYGEYHNAMGDLCEIPNGDPAMWQCINSSLWRTVRGRGLYASYYMQKAGRKARVADLCCGAFNLERRFGYLDAGLEQQVYGYDIDPDAPSVVQKLFGGAPEKYGLHLYNETMRNARNNPELLAKTNIVLINGGMSYNRSETAGILYDSRELLGKPVTGEEPRRLVADWQIGTVDMMHALKTLGLEDQHESLLPHKSIEECMADVEAKIKDVGGFEIERVITDENLYGEDVKIDPTFVQYVLKAV